jgi:hypothetical protein
MNTTYLLKDGDSVLLETQCKHVDAAVDEFFDEYPNFYKMGYTISIKPTPKN